MDPKYDEVVNFSISFLRYLNQDGQAVQSLPKWTQDPEHLFALYRMMVLTRIFDQKAINLQRTGKLGTYPSTLGMEAICVGIGAAMKPEDVLCPYYREYGAQFWRGVNMEDILLYWGGDEVGSDFKGPKEDFPISVPIASQTLHAVGVAQAFKLRGQNRVAVTTVGDGGTSRGDFYEAINVAGAWALPVVFVINNNQWAISVRREHQCKAQTLAQKCFAAGIDGVQVDGDDVFAVQYAVQEAIEKARSTQKATVIEALCYRMCDHTTADDASRYRPQEELDQHKAHDPLLRLKRYMEYEKLWDADKEATLVKQCKDQVQRAVDTYLNTPKRPLVTMLDRLYASWPKAYEEQWNELNARSV